MNLLLLLLGALAWAGVVALALGMAEWDEPVIGLVVEPIINSVSLFTAVGSSRLNVPNPPV